MDIKAEMSQKAGPLPVYGWILVISVGGYVAYRYYSSKKAAAAASASNPTVGNTLPPDTSTVDNNPNSPYSGPIVQNFLPASPVSVIPITDNDAPTGVTSPVSMPPVSKANTKLVKNTMDGTIFTEDAQGNLTWLDGPHYAALGSPKPDKFIAPTFPRNPQTTEIDVDFDGRRQHLDGGLWNRWQARGAKTFAAQPSDSRWKLPISDVLSTGV